MIARHWSGATAPTDAGAYEKLLRDVVLPSLHQIEGYRGGYVLRRAAGDEVEFVVINFFDSLDAVRAFAGPDYDIAVFEPEARRLLSRADPRAMHYEVGVHTIE